MNYTLEPKPRTYATPEELFKQTNDDPIRSKLLGKIRAGDLKRFEGLVFIDAEMEKDLKFNGPVLSQLFNKAKSFSRVPGGYRDVSARAKFNGDGKTYSITVTDDQGKVLNEGKDKYLLNFEIHPNLEEKTIQIKYVITSEEGFAAFVAGYENIFSKLSKIVRVPKWKN